MSSAWPPEVEHTAYTAVIKLGERGGGLWVLTPNSVFCTQAHTNTYGGRRVYVDNKLFYPG